jgi:hypothetical protein
LSGAEQRGGTPLHPRFLQPSGEREDFLPFRRPKIYVIMGWLRFARRRSMITKRKRPIRTPFLRDHENHLS